MRSDPEEALDTLRTSAYFRELSPAERCLKYPCHPDDEIHHLLTFGDSCLQAFRDRLMRCFRVVSETTPIDQNPRLSINIVRIALHCPMERNASWGCGQTLFLRNDEDLEHEYCHHLQREYPMAFLPLYRSWGFVPIPSQIVTDLMQRFGGISNPDTRPFSIDDAINTLDYAYDTSHAVQAIHGSVCPKGLVVCFYDQDLQTICVTVGHQPYRLQSPPCVRFLTSSPKLNHPHELLADWISSNSGNFFVLYQMTSTIPPDVRLCVCADPTTQETSAHISLDPDAPPLVGCLCTVTHDYPHAELCTSHGSSPEQPEADSSHALAKLVLLLFAGVLILSILIWIVINTVRYIRSRTGTSKILSK